MKDKIENGDYVLGTKYSDGDPADAWGIGFYDGFRDGRHYVVDSSGDQIRESGYRRCGKISKCTGFFIWQDQDRAICPLWDDVAQLEAK